MNWLLLFIPITLVLEHLGVPPTLLFFSAAIAIVPIAALIVHATEQVASRTGEAVGGLLNATFGNAPELIICLVALKAGYLEMVRAALIGGTVNGGGAFVMRADRVGGATLVAQIVQTFAYAQRSRAPGVRRSLRTAGVGVERR